MHYLRISLVVESDEPLEVVREALECDLDNSLDGVCKVVNISHDRDLASVFVTERSSRNEHQVLTPVVPSLSTDVAAVLSRYSFTLPKQKKGQPDWRVPKKALYGEVNGLPGLRGEVVLTDGIKAFLVRGDGSWCDIHWNWFVPDDLEAIPEGVSVPFRDGREDKKTEQTFAEF